MNWNIRNQILIPILVTTAMGITVATWFNIRGLVENENQRVQNQVDELFQTLESTSFPLNQSVLIQVKKISGIDLIVVEDAEITTSLTDKPLGDIKESLSMIQQQPEGKPVFLDNEYSVHSRILPQRNLEIHALYPRAELRQAVNRVVYPQIISGGATLLVLAIVVIMVARNVTDPIHELIGHVHRIAEGNFGPADKNRTDEIGQLYKSINEMGGKLKAYEQKIRAQEKLLTLDQMGGGIAHQMRNSITGCRLAIDFHREQCESDPESLEVATRQLTFMEEFQRRFLSFARESDRKMAPVDLGILVQEHSRLFEPYARHVRVELQVNVPSDPIVVHGNENMLQQVVTNLLTNAIEAASARPADEHKGRVSITVSAIDQTCQLIVRDTGPGIPQPVQGSLFEPLVTTKPDGVGLGLAIVHQIVTDHRGDISWTRIDDTTEFLVSLPRTADPQNRRET